MSKMVKQPTMAVSGLNIPTKKVHLTNLSQLPDDYCQTPGGTMFATTPGGTRIIYDRSFLLKMRNSPVASTPPKNLPYIAGVTTGISPESLKENKSPIRPSPFIKSGQSSPIQKKNEQIKPSQPTSTPTPPSSSTTTTTTTAPKKAESETLETANEEVQFSMEM